MEEIEQQLQAVEQTLLTTTDANELAALEALKADMLELLELTKSTIETTETIETATNEANNDMDDEMLRFTNEIKQLEDDNNAEAEEPVEAVKAESAENSQDIKENMEELKLKLMEMIGKKCSAPHKHNWGSISYHNAIVCGIDNNVDMDDDGILTARLRILFTNPTHREMLPCSFYLNGECRFDEERCHYSHGELVAADDLHDYIEPNFEKLTRNCVVLAKLPNRLWHKGRVLCVDSEKKTCRVRLDGNQQKQKEQDYTFEDLLPIFHDEELSSGSSDLSCNETDDETLDDYETARRTKLIEHSLFTFKPTQALGEWEKYTRGIGSKLMEKMGYIHGTGLGSNNSGIIIPVSAQILPPGRSLDHCMELREAANGDKDLFSVEKKLKREQKKQLVRNEKAYEREKKRSDTVFSFLNDNILTSQQQTTEKTTNLKNNEKVLKMNLQKQTTKSLNVESVRISDDIRRKEREIHKINESLKRNVNDRNLQKHLNQQLQDKTQELNALKRHNSTLTQEQATRRTKDKLSIF